MCFRSSNNTAAFDVHSSVGEPTEEKEEVPELTDDKYDVELPPTLADPLNRLLREGNFIVGTEGVMQPDFLLVELICSAEELWPSGGEPDGLSPPPWW
jgi:hypothetical protein